MSEEDEDPESIHDQENRNPMSTTPVIIVCRPIHLNPDDDMDAILIRQGLDVPYRGSVEDACTSCGRAVWIGPRQQSQRTDDMVVKCLICAVTDSGGDMRVKSLGNPEF